MFSVLRASCLLIGAGALSSFGSAISAMAEEFPWAVTFNQGHSLQVLAASQEEQAPTASAVLTGQLQPSELDRQWVTKLSYDGPEGNFVMVLIFRLIDGGRFSIQAKDRIGRSWWDLAVDDGAALALDRRGKTYCTYSGEVEIQAIPLGPLEFAVLPQLILGHLPFSPTGMFNRGEGRWSLQDGRGRTWFARTDGDELTSWTLLSAGKPSIWWSGVGDRWYLSAPDQQLQLRWRNGAKRALAQSPLSLQIPEGYQQDCSTERAFRE